MKKVFFISLGCSKNLIDAEVMMYLLNTNKYEITHDSLSADVIIVNTCGFIESAKKESIETILELAENKKHGECKALIVTGCLAERYYSELETEIPEIDAIIGTGDYKNIVDVLKKVALGKKVIMHGHQEDVDINELPRMKSETRLFEYIKIAEGCDNHCTYCIIPSLRGRLRSREIKSIVEEAQGIADSGIKELIIIAQDTTKYGMDKSGKSQIVKLLSELVKVEGIEWIRMLYSYPDSFSSELIDFIANEPKMCKYLDIPIQHISNSVLKRMGRKTSKEQIIKLIEDLRKRVDGIAIRTTLMVGFPGETEEEFKELMDFVAYAKFDKLGVFEYSQEENTPSYLLDGQLDDEIKTNRRNIIMELQQKISYENNKAKVNQVIDVLVEESNDENYVGRSQWDAPEIDGLIYFSSEHDIPLGSIVKVKINNGLEYDLEGELHEYSK